jgi:hypothetical protein
MRAVRLPSARTRLARTRGGEKRFDAFGEAFADLRCDVGLALDDLAGAQLIRWVTPRTVKEMFTPPRDYRYPILG